MLEVSGGYRSSDLGKMQYRPIVDLDFPDFGLQIASYPAKRTSLGGV